MSYLYNYIIGLLEDNTGIFYTHWLLKNPQFSSYIGYPTGQPVDFTNTSEPLFLRGFFFLMANFNTVAFYNIFILVSLGLVLITTYLLFNHFTKTKIVSIMLATLFTLSPYFYYQSRSHVTLIQFWLVVLFVYFLIQAKSFKHFFWLGLYLTLVTLVSNYFAYFCLLILGGYFFAKQITYKIYGLKYWSMQVWLKYLFCLITFFVTTVPILMPYFRAFYGTNDSSNQTESTDSKGLNRTLEDFFIFSSRPWYFVLPSIDNPFVGNVTNETVRWLQNDWGYFLTQNYFKSEHSASFLGWINIVMASYGVYLVIRRLREKQLTTPTSIEDSTELKILALVLVAIFLGILTLPPYITLGGIKLHMPSYILYKVFPMFRVLTRLGTVILLIVLVPTAYTYKESITKIKEKKGVLVSTLLILPIYAFSLAEFFVPIKLTDVSQMPEVFEYVKTQTPQDSVIAVFPYSRTNTAMFWIKDFQRAVVNPREFKDPKRGFNSENFTKELTKCEGLRSAAHLGVNYIVVFPNANENTEIFDKTAGLEKIAEFSASTTKQRVYKYSSIGYAGANEGAVVYKLTKVTCE